MVIYDNIFPEDFFDTIEIKGKYPTTDSNKDSYRFRDLPYRFAIDVENFLLGIGIEHQGDKMVLSQRPAGLSTKYSRFIDEKYSVFVYFINDDYKGGELLYGKEVIKPLQNRGVYFDNKDKFELAPVTEGVQYTLISYFRKNTIKQNKTLL